MKKNKSEKKQTKRTGKTSKPEANIINHKAKLTRASELQRKDYLEQAKIQSGKWEKIKDEIKQQTRRVMEEHVIFEKMLGGRGLTGTVLAEDAHLHQQRERCREEEAKLSSLWDHPSRYLDLRFRIQAGLETGLSPDDRRTVLAALCHGARVESERKSRKSFSDKFQQVQDEVNEWRTAHFEGGIKESPKRMTALVKKLGLTGDNYAPTYSKVDLVTVCYRILSGTDSVNSQEIDDLEYLCGGREKFEELFCPLPDTCLLSKKKQQKVRLKAIEKTREIINKIIGKKMIDIGFRIKNEYACYQFLRKECGLKGLPKPPLSPIE